MIVALALMATYVAALAVVVGALGFALAEFRGKTETTKCDAAGLSFILAPLDVEEGES